MTEISRRDLLKTGAAAAGASVGLASASNPASATTASWIISPVAGPAVLLGALSGLGTNNTAHGEALWDQIRATALEMEFQRNSALGSIENDAEMLAEYLRLDIAAAIVESAESDPGKDQTTDNALAVLDQEISNIKRNLFNFWTVQYMATLRRINWVLSDDTGEISVGNIFQVHRWFADGAASYPGINEGYNNFINEALLTDSLDAYLQLNDSLDDPEADASDKSGLGSLGIDFSAHFHVAEDSPTINVPIGSNVPLEDGSEYPIPLLVKSHAAEPSYENQNQAVMISPVDVTSSSNRFQYDGSNGIIEDLIPEYYDAVQQGWDGDGVSGQDTTALGSVVGRRIYVPERQQDGETIGEEGPATMVQAEEFVDVLETIDDVYQQESANISIMVDNLYDAAANGEITAEEIASGSALKEAAQEGDDWQAAAGYYRGLGLAEAHAPARYEIGPNGEVKADGILFRTVSDESTDPLPLDETINFDAQEQTGTDENGDPIMSDVWPGGLHAALEITAVDSDDPLLDETGVSEGDVGTFDLTSNDVTIVESAEDPLTFEDRGLFEPDDSTESIISVLTQAYDKEQESRSEDTNITVDFDPGGIPGLPDPPDLSKIVSGLVLLIGAAAVALGITSGDGG